MHIAYVLCSKNCSLSTTYNGGMTHQKQHNELMNEILHNITLVAH